MNSIKENHKIEIDILVSSDVHGRYIPWNYSDNEENTEGSLSQISTIVKEHRKNNRNVILLDNGDITQDNLADLFVNESQHPAVISLNYLNYDVLTLGNHEFDYGFQVLDNVLENFNGEVLAGNVFRDDGTRYFKSHMIIDVEGIKIGIIGMTTPMVAVFKKGKDIFKGKEVRNPVAETRKIVDMIKGEVDVLIGLMHMGTGNENGVEHTGIRDMANEIPEFDIIFGGHTHKLKAEVANGVLLNIPDKFGRYISKLTIEAEKTNGYVDVELENSFIEVSKYAPDEEYNALMEPFHQRAMEHASESIGRIEGLPLVPEDEIRGVPQVQISETPISNLIGDVMMHYGKHPDVVAFQIDFDYPDFLCGELKRHDISRIYNYPGGEISVYKFKGRDLKDYMEYAAGYYNRLKTGDVNISFNSNRRKLKYNTNDKFHGIKYEIDLRRREGDRIVNLRYEDGEAILPDDELTIGLNSYRMTRLLSSQGVLYGRDVKRVFSTQDPSSFGEVSGRIKQLIEKYIIEEHEGVYQAYVNNNFKIIGLEDELKYREEIVELINCGVIGTIDSDETTNVKSVNIYDQVDYEEILKLKKAGFSLEGEYANKGELYHEVYIQSQSLQND